MIRHEFVFREQEIHFGGIHPENRVGGNDFPVRIVVLEIGGFAGVEADACPDIFPVFFRTYRRSIGNYEWHEILLEHLFPPRVVVAVHVADDISRHAVVAPAVDDSYPVVCGMVTGIVLVRENESSRYCLGRLLLIQGLIDISQSCSHPEAQGVGVFNPFVYVTVVDPVV